MSADYRGDLDGLRAVAVGIVIAFHAGAPGFDAGYLGVDIFFVLSGFLITKLIASDLDANAFSFKTFYIRRAKRLLPALYVVLLACAVYLLLFQAPFAARDLSQSLVATTLFSQNFLLIAESAEYFDLASEQKPLLHMWSLGVEEQFYFLLPLALFLIRRRSANVRAAVICVALFLSFTSAIYLSSREPVITFYSLPTRAWELLVGGLVAISMTHNRHNYVAPIKLLSPNFAVLGLVTTLAVLPSLPAEAVFIGVGATVVATAALIANLNADLWVTKLTAHRFLVALGKRSYSMYLWHQPVLVVLNIEFGIHHGFLLLLYLVVPLAVLTEITYRLVERPIRYGAISNERFVSILAIVSLIILSVGLVGHTSKGLQIWKWQQLSPDATKLYISHFDEEAKRGARVKTLENTDQSVGNASATIVVMGDSIAEDTALALRMKGLDARYVRLDGLCFDRLLNGLRACDHLLADLDRSIPKASTIIIATDTANENSAEATVRLREALTANSKEVYVLNSLRFAHTSDAVFRYLRDGRGSPTDRDAMNVYAWTQLDRRVFTANMVLRRGVPARYLIDKFSFFCDQTQRSCKLFHGDGQLFFDEVHLTEPGLRHLLLSLSNQIRN